MQCKVKVCSVCKSIRNVGVCFNIGMYRRIRFLRSSFKYTPSLHGVITKHAAVISAFHKYIGTLGVSKQTFSGIYDKTFDRCDIFGAVMLCYGVSVYMYLFQT